MKMRILPAAAFLLLLPAARADNGGVLGEWMAPDGAVIAVYACNANLCARLIGLGKGATAVSDVNNPNAALRARRLCGLEIGSGFHLNDRDHADGGQLYDPKSGKTYSGSMTSDGDRLKLRGYVGLKIFGRSEVWTRVQGQAPACGR